MRTVKGMLAGIDGWQRRHRAAAVGYGVVKKFGDDRANNYVVTAGLVWFVAMYRFSLVVITVFGYMGGLPRPPVVSTLHGVPVVGSEFNPARGSANLHGNVLSLVVGLAGLIDGAQGVTESAQSAMAQVWNVPQVARRDSCRDLGAVWPVWSSSADPSFSMPQLPPSPPVAARLGRPASQCCSAWWRSTWCSISPCSGFSPLPGWRPAAWSPAWRWARWDSPCSSPWVRAWSSIRCGTVRQPTDSSELSSAWSASSSSWPRSRSTALS